MLSGGLWFLLGLVLLLAGAIGTQAVVAIGVTASVVGFLLMVGALARMFDFGLRN